MHYGGPDTRIWSLPAQPERSSAVVYMMSLIKEDLQKIIRVYDFKDALQAFEDAKSGEAIKAVIKF